MITVSGTATLRVHYSIDLKMTEEEWDALTEKEQNGIIDGCADWMDACRGGEIDDIEVDDVLEMEEEEDGI